MKETRLETRLISQHSILPNDECQLLLVPLSFRVLLFDRHGRHMSPNCNNNRSNKDKISFCFLVRERDGIEKEIAGAPPSQLVDRMPI